LSREEVSSWIVDWFSSRGKLRCTPQESLSIDYIESGLLTSLEIVEFVGELESHFGIQFSEADMQDRRFSTIGGLGELVEAVANQGLASQGPLAR